MIDAIEQAVNRIVRRCRIVNVQGRLPIPVPVSPPVLQWPSIPDTAFVCRMPKCGCPLGSVCLNAACPHAVVWM